MKEIKFTKKIQKVGTSKGIVIPQYFTELHKLQLHEEVEIIIKRVEKVDYGKN